jgi:hypothetical protein
MTTRHEFLAAAHERLQPRGYLEVGINTGKSLTLSRTRTVAVDPAFKINCELHCDLQIAKEKSDDFFARPGALDHLPGGRADLSLVDGLHLFEFAFRDFMNVEKASDWSSVIVVDDILPRSVAEASRDRGTMGAWTGDVYKLTAVLRRLRPDLVLLPLDTDPTGVLVVLGADRDSTVLADHYDELIAELVTPDPQAVPHDVLDRNGAVAPSSILDSGLWSLLVELRDSSVGREEGVARIRALVEAAAQPAPKRELTPAALRPRPVEPTLSAGTARAPGAGAKKKGAAKKAAAKKAAKKAAAKKAAAQGGLVPAAKRRLRPVARYVRAKLR